MLIATRPRKQHLCGGVLLSTGSMHIHESVRTEKWHGHGKRWPSILACFLW